MSQALSNVFKLKDIINVKDPAFGAKGDGTTNDSAAIQAAIDAAEAAGGGIVLFDSSVYAIETGLIVDNNNVYLVGQGATNFSYSSKASVRASAATTLKWTGTAGTGTMVKFTSDAADAGGGTKKGGGGLIGIFLDGQENANICFELQSWSDGYFDFNSGWARVYGIKIWTLTNALGTGVADNQNNIHERMEYLEILTAYNPVGCIIGNGGQGNTGLNKFNYLNIKTDGTGSALELENCDSNYFGLVTVGARGGSGGAAIFHADDTGVLSADTHCRNNYFAYLSPNDTLTVKATVAGSKSCRSNVIGHYSFENGGTAPTVEAGAHIVLLQQENDFVPAALYRVAPITEVNKTIFKLKPNDESVSNSTTIQFDNDLGTSLPKNKAASWRCMIFYSGDPAGDLKLGWTIPTGATMRWGTSDNHILNTADTLAIQNTITDGTTPTTIAVGTATQPRVLCMEGTITMGNTAGGLSLKWAQNTSNATATKVHGGSWLRVEIMD